MIGAVAGDGAGSVLMFVLISSAGLLESIRNRMSKAARGMIVSSSITITPSRVNLSCVRPFTVSQKSKVKSLLRAGGWGLFWMS